MADYARPGLVFDSIDEMLADVDRLRAGPVECTGEWSFGMILDHLAKGMRGEGMTPPPAFVKPIIRFIVHRMIKRSKYPKIKLKADKAIEPTDGVTVDQAYPAFVSAADMLKALPGPKVATPFGDLPRDEFLKLMLMHAGHHLSYVKSAATRI